MTTTSPDAAAAASAASGDILRAEHISKRYGAVTALTDVNVHLGRGEVLGLLGDNGAGKSTLLKILCGFQPPTTGRILLDGQEVVFKNVDHARSLGIDAVYQDLALINQLSVYHNMFLNREQVNGPILNNRSMRKLAREHLEEMGIKIPSVNVEVAKLSGGQRQAIAVARSVYSNPKILLLDEPLAAMGVKEGAIILDLVRELKEQGNVSIIIIAHNYGQVLEVCDRINLIQHGEITVDKRSADTSVTELTEHGRGRVPQGPGGAPPPRPEPADPAPVTVPPAGAPGTRARRPAVPAGMACPSGHAGLRTGPGAARWLTCR